MLSKEDGTFFHVQHCISEHLDTSMVTCSKCDFMGPMISSPCHMNHDIVPKHNDCSITYSTAGLWPVPVIYAWVFQLYDVMACAANFALLTIAIIEHVTGDIQ